MKRSSVNIFAVANIEYKNLLYEVVDLIYDPVITHPYAVIVAVKEFFAANWTGICPETKNPVKKFVLKIFVGFMEKLFRCSFDRNGIAHFFRFLRISSTTSSKGLNFPLRRFFAIARSIISSLSSLIARTLEMNISRARGGSVLNCIKNLFAVCEGVMARIITGGGDRGQAGGYKARSTKHEIPFDFAQGRQNKSEYQNTKYAGASVLDLESSNLDIVSNFEFRISNFNSAVALSLN